jgi:malate dehydrogenase (oxaloacetate-decarboxylating)(NADP+)
MASFSREEVLNYHSSGRPGKIEVVPTKRVDTQRDLSLAYTPGVAHVVEEIERSPESVFDYTARGNLVAVITNGTAILGLGDRGPLAAKPVMEGKAILFKRFADIDVFDIELSARTTDEMVATVTALAPTFGGINLEDIKAPECFEVERRLRETLDIPVFHDDQHGTALITGAALLNALEVAGKKIGDVKVVVSGAGAAAIACAEFYVTMGARRENIRMVDRTGVVYRGRATNMNAYKERFAADTDERSLADAARGADVFLGLSGKDVLAPAVLASMAKRPVVFACANPDPEIRYELARETRSDVIIGTGRSDYPNQINNLLGFPFIFRGALDVRARTINDEMKLAAARALADLAHEGVPECMLEAFGQKSISFGEDYLIPKPLDPRILFWVAPAVSRAAMETGVARRQVNIPQYIAGLEERRRHCYRQCRFKDSCYPESS